MYRNQSKAKDSAIPSPTSPNRETLTAASSTTTEESVVAAPSMPLTKLDCELLEIDPKVLHAAPTAAAEAASGEDSFYRETTVKHQLT
jgi:hypothetical protein